MCRNPVILATSASLAILFSSGCASLINGIKQDVRFYSSPPGAHVTAENVRTGKKYETTTPGKVDLARKGEYRVFVSLDGHETVERSIDRTISAWTVLDFFFYIIPGFVDMAVGSAWDLTPRQVDVVLPISQAASRQGTAVQTAHNEISPRIPLPTRTFPRRNIAIAPLEALGLSQSGALTLTESLRVTLGDSDYFNIVTRSDMEKILKEQDFQRSSSSDTQCLVEMGKILAVEKIIGGTVGRVGDTFSLSVRMIDVESGKIDHSVLKNISGKEDRLLDAMPVLGSELALKYAESRRE